MLTDVLPYLRCPVCRAELTLATGGGSVRCPAGHSFDAARQGYLHLGHGPVSHSGDTAAMVAAREAFLNTGGYEFIADALAEAAGATATRQPAQVTGARELAIEVGAGTGYYLARVLERLPELVGLAVDVAKPALRRAARAHPRAGAVLADAWQRLPVADHCASLLLDVFAPRNPAEFARVLAPGGRLLVVTPTPDHLAELAGLLDVAGVRLLGVPPEKPTQVTAALAESFAPVGESFHTRQLQLAGRALRALVEMGPSAAHTDPGALAAAVSALAEPVRVTASVQLTQFTPHLSSPS